MPFPELAAYLERRLDYPGLDCRKCWELHCADGAAYPCPECPAQLPLSDADRLALDVWRTLAPLDRPALAQLAVGVCTAQLAALTPGEWLGLLDRLAYISSQVPHDDPTTTRLLLALLRARGPRG